MNWLKIVFSGSKYVSNNEALFALDKTLIITSKQFLVLLEYTLGSKNILFSKRSKGNMHLSKMILFRSMDSESINIREKLIKLMQE